MADPGQFAILSLSDAAFRAWRSRGTARIPHISRLCRGGCDSSCRHAAGRPTRHRSRTGMANRSAPMKATRWSSTRSPSLHRIEIAQVRRRLAFAGRHQAAVGAEEIVLPADEEVVVVGAFAGMLEPCGLAFAPVDPGHRPWPRQGVVDGGDLVLQGVRIVAVEMDVFLDDGLVVLVQGQAGGFESARPADVARLDAERMVAAVVVRIDPLADGIARKRRFDILRPGAAVGIDPAQLAEMLLHDVGHVWED